MSSADKMCERMDDAPPSASIIHTTTQHGIYQENVTFRCYLGYHTLSGSTQQTITCDQGEWSAYPDACDGKCITYSRTLSITLDACLINVISKITKYWCDRIMADAFYNL